MLPLLQKTAGAVFFLLGTSFFVAYVLLRNGVFVNEAAVWMQAADLPLAGSAVTYAGVSVYAGLRDPKKRSLPLALAVAVPLALFFATVVAMNFWPV